MKYCSHTLVKNGDPFIDLVLRQVLPSMDRMLITVSVNSTDKTVAKILQLKKENPDKIFVEFEDVRSPGLLTWERQKMVEKTTEDWILFLDDDDVWFDKDIKECKRIIETEKNLDGLALNPYQIIDERHEDSSWSQKWFTKWIRNDPKLHYRRDWPRDIIFIGDKYLYWRENLDVPRVMNARYFHLSNIKTESFRNTKWAEEFFCTIGPREELPQEAKVCSKLIFDHARRDK